MKDKKYKVRYYSDGQIEIEAFTNLRKASELAKEKAKSCGHVEVFDNFSTREWYYDRTIDGKVVCIEM